MQQASLAIHLFCNTHENPPPSPPTMTIPLNGLEPTISQSICPLTRACTHCTFLCAPWFRDLSIHPSHKLHQCINSPIHPCQTLLYLTALIRIALDSTDTHSSSLNIDVSPAHPRRKEAAIYWTNGRRSIHSLQACTCRHCWQDRLLLYRGHASHQT